MPNERNRQYVYTDLSQTGTMVLTIDGQEYDVVQFSATFAKNTIPRATCLLAVGRNARDTSKFAKIHETGIQLKEMTDADVRFRPTKDWDSQGTQWPEGEEVIFRGKYAFFGYRRVNNRLHGVVQLVHWLISLTFSSTLDVNNHPTNPTSLVAPAIMPGLNTGVAGSPAFISDLVGYESIASRVREDLWHGTKQMLCELTKVSKMKIRCPPSTATGPGNKQENTMAQEALKRIQGPGGDCALDYNAVMGGMPLALDDEGISLVKESVARTIMRRSLQEAAHYTFWDYLVGQFVPEFGLALIPQVEIATVTADTPAINKVYKTLSTTEFEADDINGTLSKPLQGVGVYGAHEAATGVDKTESNNSGNVCVGGHYAADSVKPGDGLWWLVPAPAWLHNIPQVGVYAGSNTGVVSQDPQRSSTTPDANPAASTEQTPKALIEQQTLNKLYDRYARMVFVENALKGRFASLSGKLRFDIAPGSILKLQGAPELFAQGEDKLAVDVYGQVISVTININAESQLAGTTLQLSHIRTEGEFNAGERTNVLEHPLFGSNVYYGAPLIENWRF